MINENLFLNSPCSNFSYRYRQFNDSLSFFTNLNYFELDICQLNGGKFYGDSLEITTPNVKIDRHLHSLRMKISGTPVKTWAFAIPMLPIHLLFDNKYDVQDNYILLSPPQSEFNMIQKSPYGIYVIYFSQEFFFDLCENYHLPDPPKLLGPAFLNASALTCSQHRLNSLRRDINHFFQKALIFLSFRAKSDFIYSYFINNIISQLEVNVTRNLMLLLAESRQVVVNKVTLKRSAVLHQAEAFINTYAKADIRTADICRATGVSQRTMEYIFRDFYGLSPKAYLKQWRLNRFRLALRQQTASGSKVNEIGTEWGFWHSGQLAHDYHHLFGELPSETLKKSM